VKNKLIKNEFTNYVESYDPFPWEKNANDPRPDIRNKHNLLLSFIRHLKILQYLQDLKRYANIKTIIDVGPFPGDMVRIVKDLLDNDIEYIGIGLGFTSEFSEAMDKLKVGLFSTDLDPDFFDAKECKEWPVNNADVCLFLDVIEHLVNPLYCLDQINRSLTLGGHVIITTDNISNFGNTYNMIRHGDSPNIHPLRSSLFYRGDWRPHFREFSKSELLFYLKYCGFDLVKHEYFERKQGDFYFDANGKIFEKSRYKGAKGIILKNVLRYVSHLRDHQILTAKKILDYEDNIKKRPKVTSSMDEWLKMRADAGIF
jgi:SAM-dependent methyltransferase